MKRSVMLALGLLVWTQAPQTAKAGPLPFADMTLHSATPRDMNLQTRWGYGSRENVYNEMIAVAVTETWAHQDNPLPPLLYKSLLAVESSFNPNAVSYAGAAGISQLMPDTGRRFGLTEGERLDPKKALPVGIMALQEKYRVICDPGNYYKVVGLNAAKPCPWGDRVAQFYQSVGMPQGDDRWALTLGAYNGGGGTVLRAMAYAVDQGLDARKWDVIAGPVGQSTGTPLHQACVEVYGARNATRKAAELAAYPRKILGLYRSVQPLSSNP